MRSAAARLRHMLRWSSWYVRTHCNSTSAKRSTVGRRTRVYGVTYGVRRTAHGVDGVVALSDSVVSRDQRYSVQHTLLCSCSAALLCVRDALMTTAAAAAAVSQLCWLSCVASHPQSESSRLLEVRSKDLARGDRHAAPLRRRRRRCPGLTFLCLLHWRRTNL